MITANSISWLIPKKISIGPETMTSQLNKLSKTDTMLIIANRRHWLMWVFPALYDDPYKIRISQSG